MIDLDNIHIISDDRNTPSVNAESKSSSLEAVYDRHMKLIYCVDISGSMSSYLFNLEDIEDFDWTGSKSLIQRRIRNAVNRLGLTAMLEEYGACASSEGEEHALPPALHALRYEDPSTDHIWVSMAGQDPLLQRTTIVQYSLFNEIGLAPQYRRINYAETPSKIAVVRSELKKLIEERFQRFPEADVHLVRFGARVHYSPWKTRADLLQQVENLSACESNTVIGAALARCVSMCKRRPSQVAAHHVVLISDGLDSTLSPALPHLVQEMKNINIVLDFIHVGSPSEVISWESCIKDLRAACKELNGEYKIVSRSKDLRNRLQEAGRRLCLPAPSNS
mgnify:FL=1